MNIRKLIKETVAQVINEAPKDFIDLGPNVGLVIQYPSSEQVWLNFFDFKDKKCIGVITLRKLTTGIWHINTVAGEQGLGPLLYKTGMMAVYPDGVCADRIHNSKAAVNVWHKFYLSPGELKKIPITKDNEAYKDYGNEDLNIILNFLYYRPESTWFKKMVDKGVQLMSSSESDSNAIRGICSDYFKSRYQEK